MPSVTVVGAGAIGSTLAGWVAPRYGNLSLLARGESASVIQEKGLKLYLKGQRTTATPIPLRVIRSISEIPPPDILVIAVKNYDLDATARDLRNQLGSLQPIVVGLQNGVDNQRILPKYFSKIIYGVISFNAWRDGPGEVGHDEAGLIVLGTPTNDLKDEMEKAARIFHLGLNCTITDRLQDAAHCKLVVNQANALLTLVGFQRRPIKSMSLLVHITMSLMWEGVQLIKMAGFKEHPLGKIPSWRFIETGAKLPSFLMNGLYRFSTRKLGLNSMSQDVFGGKAVTELESLNGYMLRLSQKVGFPSPINETIYEVAKERFSTSFEPISEIELWNLIKERQVMLKR
jgi:2-dehydropantoate 2-reductase